jgi:hypothetical protein
MTLGRVLFEKVVERTGLASFIGPGTVERALLAAGVESVEAATADDYRRAMPQLRRRMAVYLPPDGLERQVRKLEELLAG